MSMPFITLSTLSSTNNQSPAVTFLFRFLLLYIGIQLLPLDGQFVRNLFDFGGGYTHYLFEQSKYAPHFVGSESFLNWGIVAGIALAGAVVWTNRDRSTKLDREVYNWLRIAVRYRLALAVIAYGFLKLFALQAPLPSLSNLNTAYGDHSAWKLFSLSLGIVPGYQSFLGGVELLGGLLLLNRKTTVIGTLILLPFLGNVFFSNLAYEGGEYVYSGLLLTFGLFLFGHDAIRLFRLVSLELTAQPDQPAQSWTRSQQTTRFVLKGAFIVMTVLLYGITTARVGSGRFPQTPGLPGVAGLYRVAEFRQGGQEVPYSLQTPTRWQDVVFETWNTISIRSNRPVQLQHTRTEELPATDEASDYELAGSQGRHYYRYTVDPSGRVLTLQNANPNHLDDRLTGTPMRLTLTRQNDSTGSPTILVLAGVDAKRNSVHARLTKVNKKYLLQEAAKAGRRGSLTL